MVKKIACQRHPYLRVFYKVENTISEIFRPVVKSLKRGDDMRLFFNTFMSFKIALTYTATHFPLVKKIGCQMHLYLRVFSKVENTISEIFWPVLNLWKEVMIYVFSSMNLGHSKYLSHTQQLLSQWLRKLAARGIHICETFKSWKY